MILHSTQFELKSTAFINGEVIPQKYTCDGNDISPPLSWSHAPAGTKSFVLFVVDPDAPDPAHPQRTWTHWVLYNIPGDLEYLEEAASNLPRKAEKGLNDWKNKDYGGPCPPIGRHRYFFKIYALDIDNIHLDRPSRALLEETMKGHVLAEAELMGTYIKKGDE